MLQGKFLDLQFNCVLADNPPSPGEVGHTTGVYVPYSFQTVVWVLLRPTRTNQRRWCETGPTVFRPYPRRLESLTVFQMSLQRQHFLLSYFKTLIVLVRAGIEPTKSLNRIIMALDPRPPAEQYRRSPKRTNQAAVEE